MPNLDTGNTAFMILAACLVMLMTPGLAFFYGGLVGRKNVLAIMIQSFVSMGITTVFWFLCGYSLCFSPTDYGGIIGDFHYACFAHMGPTQAYPGSPTIPLFVFCTYQMMFAIITPALISGAFTNRIRFGAYNVFLILWLALVYCPFVHMIWGGGLLAKWGVQDFAGGIVVHAIAGFAALASVIFVGKRASQDKGPHSIPLVALGTGLLWFGWYGFNAGSQLKVDGVTGLAFLNTDIAASFAATVWLIMAWVFEKKPKFLGLLTGAVAGLATITPCAGFVSTPAAVVIGSLSGVVCYIAIWGKNAMKWDDALDVWGVHGVGGVLGTVMLGVFGWSAINPAGVDGLLHGGGTNLLAKQAAAVGIAAAYAYVFTYGVLWAIQLVMPVKVSAQEQEVGLDAVLHGEHAYTCEAEPDGLTPLTVSSHR